MIFYDCSMIIPFYPHETIILLVGGLVAIFYFPIFVGFLIIPTDEIIFFRGVAQPPTSNIWLIIYG